MVHKPTYEELEQRIKELENEADQRRQAEDALRESKELYRSLVENAGSSIDYFDTEGRIILTNRNVAQDLGMDGETLVSRSIFELFPNQAALFWERLEKAIKEKQGADFEDLVELPGAMRWFMSHIHPVEDSKGRVAGVLSISTDITDRKLAEEILRESEEKYRMVVDNSVFPIVYFTLDGKVQLLNTIAAINMNGKPEDFIGKSLYELFPAMADKTMERIRRIIETGSGSNFEDSFELPSGQHWFLTNFQPVRGANGEINAMQMISFDITARKRAEEALQQSRKNLKDAQRIARIGNFKWDIADKVFEWSDEITRIFGVGLEAFNGEVGKIMDAIVPRKDLGMVHDAYEQAFAEGKFCPVEWPFKTLDGKEKFINVEGDLICDEDGKAVAVFGTVQDITERKKVEEELQKARNYIRNIVNSMPSILVGVDPEGTVTQWNLEAEKATGVAASKAQGRALIDVFPLLAGEMAKVKQAMRNRAPQKDTKVAYESDGETRFSDVTVYPLVANGVEGAVIRVDDVTDRVRIEEMMIQSEKMFSVGGLAAGMAHEINNPLAGILQNVQVMKNRMTGDLAKNRHTAEECGTTMAAVESYMEKRGMFRMIEAVMESGKRAARTVDNMLSFSRKSESQFAVHDLCEILDKTVDLADKDYDLKKKYDFRQIEIVRQYEDSLPQVSCEGSKIQQVFLNLLKNGAQAMTEDRGRRTEGGGQRVDGSGPAGSRFILRVMKDGDMARIEIEDNGPGMTEEVRKRVFEPFFTTKGVGVGTGLGLSVSYFIVTDNHGGTMAVESKPGRGAKFIIRLPLEHSK